MSLNGLVETQVYGSNQKLSSISGVAKILLEDVTIRIERQVVDPLIDTDATIQSVTAILHSAAHVETADSQIALNIASAQIREEIRKTIGHSPDIFSDIADAIIAPVKGIVDTALKPIADTIAAIGNTIKGFIDDAVTLIGKGVTATVLTVKGWINTGITTLQNGATAIQNGVNSLISDIASGIDFVALTFNNLFANLIKGITDVFSFEPGDLLKMQTEMSTALQTQQADYIKQVLKERG